MYDKQPPRTRVVSFIEDNNMIKLKHTLLAALATAAFGAHAAAPMVKTPAPGYLPHDAGRLRNHAAVSDGTVDLPVDQLLHQKGRTDQPPRWRIS
jgi:hypothetical protein